MWEGEVLVTIFYRRWLHSNASYSNRMTTKKMVFFYSFDKIYIVYPIDLRIFFHTIFVNSVLLICTICT